MIADPHIIRTGHPLRITRTGYPTGYISATDSYMYTHREMCGGQYTYTVYTGTHVSDDRSWLQIFIDWWGYLTSICASKRERGLIQANSSESVNSDAPKDYG